MTYVALHLFQGMMEAQNRRIDDLVDRIKQQQEKLDKQNIRIRTLQNQVGQCPNSASMYYSSNWRFTHSLLWVSGHLKFPPHSQIQINLQSFLKRKDDAISQNGSIEQRDSPLGKPWDFTLIYRLE